MQLLEKQEKVTEPKGLGITMGNSDAPHKLIKVCNPYCGPCAQAHPVIEELLKNNPNIQLQIIFAASEDDIQKANGPIKHLLTIAAKEDATLTEKALDDWYNAPDKNYEAFSAKYPIGEESQVHNEHIRSMIDWCRKAKINYTPTVFINGHLIPEIYTVRDLKYFFAE